MRDHGLPRNLQHAVTEFFQEGYARLLARFVQRDPVAQFDDEHAFVAGMLDGERADFAAAQEAMGPQAFRTQQVRERFSRGAMGSGSGSILEDAGKHGRTIAASTASRATNNWVICAETRGEQLLRYLPRITRDELPPTAHRSDRPQATYRTVLHERADAAMTCTSLQAARILCPLHGVDRGIEARADQFDEVPMPGCFRLHDDRLSLDANHSTPSGGRQFLSPS